MNDLNLKMTPADEAGVLDQLSSEMLRALYGAPRRLTSDEQYAGVQRAAVLAQRQARKAMHEEAGRILNQTYGQTYGPTAAAGLDYMDRPAQAVWGAGVEGRNWQGRGGSFWDGMGEGARRGLHGEQKYKPADVFEGAIEDDNWRNLAGTGLAFGGEPTSLIGGPMAKAALGVGRVGANIYRLERLRRLNPGAYVLLRDRLGNPVHNTVQAVRRLGQEAQELGRGVKRGASDISRGLSGKAVGGGGQPVYGAAYDLFPAGSLKGGAEKWWQKYDDLFSQLGTWNVRVIPAKNPALRPAIAFMNTDDAMRQLARTVDPDTTRRYNGMLLSFNQPLDPFDGRAWGGELMALRRRPGLTPEMMRAAWHETGHFNSARLAEVPRNATEALIKEMEGQRGRLSGLLAKHHGKHVKPEDVPTYMDRWRAKAVEINPEIVADLRARRYSEPQIPDEVLATLTSDRRAGVVGRVGDRYLPETVREKLVKWNEDNGRLGLINTLSQAPKVGRGLTGYQD